MDMNVQPVSPTTGGNIYNFFLDGVSSEPTMDVSDHGVSPKEASNDSNQFSDLFELYCGSQKELVESLSAAAIDDYVGVDMDVIDLNSFSEDWAMAFHSQGSNSSSSESYLDMFELDTSSNNVDCADAKCGHTGPIERATSPTQSAADELRNAEATYVSFSSSDIGTLMGVALESFGEPERFNYGFQALFRGDELGFGRQPSFRRLQSETECGFQLGAVQDDADYMVSASCHETDVFASSSPNIMTSHTHDFGVYDESGRRKNSDFSKLRSSPRTSFSGKEEGPTGRFPTAPHTLSCLGDSVRREINLLMDALSGDMESTGFEGIATHSGGEVISNGNGTSRASTGISGPLPHLQVRHQSIYRSKHAESNPSACSSSFVPGSRPSCASKWRQALDNMLSSEVLQMRETDKEMNMMAGAHPVSRSRTPKRVDVVQGASTNMKTASVDGATIGSCTMDYPLFGVNVLPDEADGGDQTGNALPSSTTLMDGLLCRQLPGVSSVPSEAAYVCPSKLKDTSLSGGDSCDMRSWNGRTSEKRWSTGFSVTKASGPLSKADSSSRRGKGICDADNGEQHTNIENILPESQRVPRASLNHESSAAICRGVQLITGRRRSSSKIKVISNGHMTSNVVEGLLSSIAKMEGGQSTSVRAGAEAASMQHMQACHGEVVELENRILQARQHIADTKGCDYLIPNITLASNVSEVVDTVASSHDMKLAEERHKTAQRSLEERKERVKTFMEERKAEKRLKEEERRRKRMEDSVGGLPKPKESILTDTPITITVAQTSPRRNRAMASPKRPQTLPLSPYLEMEGILVTQRKPVEKKDLSKTNASVKTVVVSMSANHGEDTSKRDTPSATASPLRVTLRDNNVLEVRQSNELPRFFEVDEFIDLTGQDTKLLPSFTLLEMNRKFLAGMNVALLAASTSSIQDSMSSMLFGMVTTTFSNLPPNSELFLSAALVCGGLTEDLLTEPGCLNRTTFTTSPLTGIVLDKVRYTKIGGTRKFAHLLHGVYERAEMSQRLNPGLLIISLVLKQVKQGDVVLSSCLFTNVGAVPHTYNSILRKSERTLAGILHSALAGPSFTVTVFAVGQGDHGAVQLLNTQHKLASQPIKPAHIGSVKRFVELAEKELRSQESNSVNETAEVRPKCSARRRRLAMQLAAARNILENPQCYIPAGDTITATAATCSSPPEGAHEVPPSKESPVFSSDLVVRGVSSAKAASSTTASCSVAHDPVWSSAPPAMPSKVGKSSHYDDFTPQAPRAVPRRESSSAQVLFTTKSLSRYQKVDPINRRPSTTTTNGQTAGKDTSALPPVVMQFPMPAEANTPAASTSPKRPTGTLNAGGLSKSGSPPRIVQSTIPLPAVVSVSVVTLSPVKRRTGKRTKHFALSKKEGAKSSSIDCHLPRKGAVNSTNTTNHSGKSRLPVAPSLPVTAISNGGKRYPTRDTPIEVDRSLPAPYPNSPGPKTQKSGSRTQQVRALQPAHLTESEPKPATRSTRGHHARNSPLVSDGRGKTVVSSRRSLDSNSSVKAKRGATEESNEVTESTTNIERRGVTPAARGPRGYPAFGSMSNAMPSTPLQKSGGDIIPPAGSSGNAEWGGGRKNSNATLSSNTRSTGSGIKRSERSNDRSAPKESLSTGSQANSAYNNAVEVQSSPFPSSTKVRTVVVVDPRCRETSNVTYDNTMVIATTEDDFEEYDVDEVIPLVATGAIQSDRLKELCDTVLLGGNAAILGADSRSSPVSQMVLKSVVRCILSEIDQRGARSHAVLTASIVRLKGETVIDLTTEKCDPMKLVIAISPIFGSCVHGVRYLPVDSHTAFATMLDDALSRATEKDRDHGLIFCLLILKSKVSDQNDVLVSSLVATLVGENVGHYMSVLDKSPLVPRALFHYALGGPCYTVALLGISSDESHANQMLQVQKRLGEISNRLTHPGSITKFIVGIRDDLAPKLMQRLQETDVQHKEVTQNMLDRLTEMVRDAEALLMDFDHHEPKAYLHGERKESDDSSMGKGRAAASTPLSRDAAPSSRGRQSRVLPNIHVASSPNGENASATRDNGSRIKSLVFFDQHLLGGGSVAVQDNSVLVRTGEFAMRFDSDEVVTRNDHTSVLESNLIDELVGKFLTGHCTGLLAGDSSNCAFMPVVLRKIAYYTLYTMTSEGGENVVESFSKGTIRPVQRELKVSMALIKDDITADLLPVDENATFHRFAMKHSPIYGSCIQGVTSHLVTSVEDFDHFLSVAIDNADSALQTSDPGIMAVSLVLTQRVEQPVEDVFVSSFLCTTAFDAVHHYTGVLAGNPAEPLELFRSVLNGPAYTIAMLGLSDEDDDADRLLRVLNELSHVVNRTPQPNSVAQHIADLKQGILTLRDRMTTASNPHDKEFIKGKVIQTEAMLKEAETLMRYPVSQAPQRAFVPLGAPMGP